MASLQNMSLYFVAVTAPEPVNKQVLAFKLYMQEKYGCKVALKSPAHVTLIPPFTLSGEDQPRLEQALNDFAAGQIDLPIELKDFAAFAPRVIYVDVVAGKALSGLQAALEKRLLELAFPIRRSPRDFHPHVTIANRDLQPDDFREAWDHFRQEQFAALFAARGISLLHLENGRWATVHTSFFRDPF